MPGIQYKITRHMKKQENMTPKLEKSQKKETKI